MTRDAIWQPLAEELRLWAGAGGKPQFWLRDDDAISPNGALDRLLGLTCRQAVPVGLAVIPAHTGRPLAERLAGEAHATVLVHGWSHANHAPGGAKKQELGLHRPQAVVLAELAEGLGRLMRLHGDRAAPVLVPPWNRIARDMIPHLPALGFSALSVFGAPYPAPLAMVNSTVDIMDWHGARGCRDHGVLVGEIVAQLQAARSVSAQPIGLLSHHLVHDEAAWTFLERLFQITGQCAPDSWTPVRSLIPS